MYVYICVDTEKSFSCDYKLSNILVIVIVQFFKFFEYSLHDRSHGYLITIICNDPLAVEIIYFETT